MDLLTLQYIILGLIVLASCYSLFRILKKNFSPKKFDSKRNCRNDCGCNS